MTKRQPPQKKLGKEEEALDVVVRASCVFNAFPRRPGSAVHCILRPSKALHCILGAKNNWPKTFPKIFGGQKTPPNLRDLDLKEPPSRKKGTYLRVLAMFLIVEQSPKAVGLWLWAVPRVLWTL